MTEGRGIRGATGALHAHLLRHDASLARLASRVVIPGLPHHVTQRGVRRQDVFFSDEDRLKYLDLIGEAAEQYGGGLGT